MNNVLICAKKLHFTYEGADSFRRTALCDISLAVGEGEFLALIGPNGSGKSTLARHFNGLLLPTAGKVWVGGLDTSDEKNLRLIRQQVGMVFQNPENQFVAGIVEEDVAFGPENLGLPSTEIAARVEESLAMVGLTALRNRPPHHLSGGQKQLLAIAGVLAMRPKCLVLDEPTAMLDPVGRRRLLATVRKLNRELGITVVYITNLMDEAALADRLVVLNEGHIACEGKPAVVFANADKLLGLGLGLPPAVQMAKRLQERGLGIPNGTVSLEGLVDSLCRL